MAAVTRLVRQRAAAVQVCWCARKKRPRFDPTTAHLLFFGPVCWGKLNGRAQRVKPRRKLNLRTDAPCFADLFSVPQSPPQRGVCFIFVSAFVWRVSRVVSAALVGRRWGFICLRKSIFGLLHLTMRKITLWLFASFFRLLYAGVLRVLFMLQRVDISLPFFFCLAVAHVGDCSEARPSSSCATVFAFLSFFSCL